MILACWVVIAGYPNSGLTILVNSDPVTTNLAVELSPQISVESQQNDLDFPTAVASLGMMPVPQLDLQLELLDTGEKSDSSHISQEMTLAKSVVRRMTDHELDSEVIGQGASFFGVYAPGSKFVYILDSSSSMEGERWQLAREKLLHSLRLLGPEREFFVICFDHQTTLLFDSSPSHAEFHHADSATIRKVERWLRSRVLGSSTMPAEALRFAMNMKPDAIFLLSDGELRDHSLIMLRLFNAHRHDYRQIPIHAVHLISPAGKATLERIAEENGGTFTFVAEEQRRSPVRQ